MSAGGYMKNLLNNILTDYSDDEEKYDLDVSSCINNAAKKGLDLSLGRATESARKKFQAKSRQNNRLEATYALFDNKHAKFKPAFDPTTLSEYHFEIHDCNLD